MTYTASNLLKLMFANDTAGLASKNNIIELLLAVNTELKRLRAGLGQRKWWLISTKTQLIIFNTKWKRVDQGVSLIYNDNEPNQNNPDLIYTIERFHTSHPIKKNRAHKLLSTSM